jgi:hypothetical protein
MGDLSRRGIGERSTGRVLRRHEETDVTIWRWLTASDGTVMEENRGSRWVAAHTSPGLVPSHTNACSTWIGGHDEHRREVVEDDACFADLIDAKAAPSDLFPAEMCEALPLLTGVSERLIAEYLTLLDEHAPAPAEAQRRA